MKLLILKILITLLNHTVILYYRYEFNGTFKDGKMNGNGTLHVFPSAPLQKRCILLKESVLNLPSPNIVEGHFEEGFIDGIANITWSELNLQMNAHVNYGMVHGMFKIHDLKNERIMIGQATRNKVVDDCWLIFKGEVKNIFTS